jgi:hypothetical protein
MSFKEHKPPYSGGKTLRELLGRIDGRWFSLRDVIRNISPCEESKVDREAESAVDHLVNEGHADYVDWFEGARIVSLKGMILLSTRAKTEEGKLFEDWVLDVIATVLNEGSYTAPEEIPTGGDVNPLDAFGAIYNVMKNQDKRIDGERERNDGQDTRITGCEQKIDKVIEADDVSSCRKYLTKNKVEYDDILNEYELMEFETQAKLKKKMLSRNDYMTAAAAKVGKACSAMAQRIDARNGSHIYDDACARAFDVGNFVGVKQWPVWIIQACVRDILGG